MKEISSHYNKSFKQLLLPFFEDVYSEKLIQNEK